MKFTYNWLKDYLKTDLTPNEIAEKLTAIGLEVESLYPVLSPVVARITECEKIPDTHLHLLKVDDGITIRQIVCGAHNCRVGLIGALARPGTIIEGREIGIGKLKGYESQGMMCSVRELGIGVDHEGIIDLQKDWPVIFGEDWPAAHSLGVVWNGEPQDFVFDISVLPNMAHCLAVWAIANDLAAAGAGEYVNYDKECEDALNFIRRNVTTAEPFLDTVPVFMTVRIDGVKVVPSADYIQKRLLAIGITPRNAIVDATNHVCYSDGHPLHAYDADKVKGDIFVRYAKEGEKFTDLLGAEHSLLATDLVVVDDEGPLCLAGVIGGQRSMVTDDTKNIILEAAYFDPLTVRKTRTRLGISTDASFRFERGINRAGFGLALATAAWMIIKDAAEHGSGAGGEIKWLKKNRKDFEPITIEYDLALFEKRIGMPMSAETQIDILKKLGYEVEISTDKTPVTLVVKQPSWRVDDAIPEKLVSDIIRIYGFENIPMTGVTAIEMTRRDKVPNYDDIRAFFAKNRNLMESHTFGFGNLANEKLVSDKPHVEVANPITDYMNTARNSLIPNMLDTIAANEKRGYHNLAMFELGTVFDGPNPGEEHKQLVIARTGEAEARHWLKRGPRPVDVFDVKSDLIAFFGDAETETNNPAIWAHPYRYGRLACDGETLAEFGELHPKLAKYWKIKVPVMLGLITDVSIITQLSTINSGHSATVVLPPIMRDFSFILEKEIPASVILSAARSADPQIVNAREFDFYENSIAFEITIQPDRNLSDADLMDIQNRVIAAIEPCGAKIRDRK